jgi:hypothetical protein
VGVSSGKELMLLEKVKLEEEYKDLLSWKKNIKTS